MYNYFNFYFCDCVEQELDSILPKKNAKQKFSFFNSFLFSGERSFAESIKLFQNSSSDIFKLGNTSKFTKLYKAW